MTILIEDAESLEYLDANSGWTKNAVDAMAFPSTGAAFATAKKQPIGKFNIVGCVGESRQLVNMDHGRGSGAETTRT